MKTLALLLISFTTIAQPHGNSHGNGPPDKDRPCHNPNQPGCAPVPVDDVGILIIGALLGIVRYRRKLKSYDKS
jgi:hypothetical protein